MTRWLSVFLLSVLVGFVAMTREALAQDRVWIQIEAQPSLVEAQERVRDYAANLADVNGFALGGGWYAIALGPYAPTDAQQRLRELRAQGRIPRDSYIAFSSTYRQQFWPVGANLLATPALPDAGPEPRTEPETSPGTAVAEALEDAQDALPPQPEPDETPREARASERLLERAEREQLQIALQWAGFYTAAIDGAFGRGTRASMAAWQEANGLEPTGVLTTRQRAELLRQYNAVLDGLDLTVTADARTGIEMALPRGIVAFDGYEAPFARYEPSGDLGAELGARVLQISQPGTQATLFGLYDILQTLEIVPLDGPRERRRDGFSITGRNDRIVSQTEVSLRDGEIKGFVLIWPTGDEERRSRVLNEMQKSFRRIPGVLPADTGVDLADQTLDLVSGLRVRKPVRGRSGFFVDGAGQVLTSADAVAGCGTITLDGEYKATLRSLDAARGLALLQPDTPLAPQVVAQFGQTSPRIKSEIAVAGYSFGGVLGAPTMTFGALADTKGLRGEQSLDRLALSALEGDEGGPVVDQSGAVIGLLQGRWAEGRQLPDDVSFATDVDTLRAALSDAGVTPQTASAATPLAPEDLTARATRMTVLVSCWE